MKPRIIIMLCMAGLVAACSQKQSEVLMPVSQIDVEQLNKDIDYNMDVTGLSISDLRVLRNAPAARRGYPFRDAYLRGVYSGTTWYDSLTWVFDEAVNSVETEQKEGESWRDQYYRMGEEAGILDYSAEELAFMKRLKEREDELMKHNFDVTEGLRVNMQNLINPSQLKDFDSTLCTYLGQNGFAIVPAEHEQLFNIYEENDYGCFPSFITTDLYLQAYHLYIDCMLRELEEHVLLPLMIDFTHEMFNSTHQMYVKSGLIEEDNRITLHNVAFFCVAHKLFTGEDCGLDDEMALANPEVEKILKSENAFSDFMMDYKEITFPYSLFRPRGHYTRSEALKRYFRGMMWLQSAPFGLDNREELKEAVMMAFALKYNDNARKKYDKLNKLITFMMGQPDNISIIQVLDEVNKIGNSNLVDDEKGLDLLKQRLDKLANEQTRIRPKFEYTSHTKVCLLPQRYQPDAEVLQEMVDYDSKITQRPLPTGLDFFAAMGIAQAEQILIDEGQKWKDFKPTLAKMKKRMGEIDWNETTATQWMDALRLVAGGLPDKNKPYYMGTPEWGRKDLNAALASWAELKHDAILYAKQPFGAECGGGGLPEPVVKGYVEPRTDFWKKAITLLENTSKLLKSQGMLTEKIEQSTERLTEEAQFLLRVSEKELAGKRLTEEEYDHINYMGATFENISLDLLREPNQDLYGWSDVQGADKKVALVADVYTANAMNNPSKSILYEAIGAADEIYVVVEIEGYLYLTRGAVFSYREFNRSVDQQRLTDEEWQKELESKPREGVPAWMLPIQVGLKKTPELNEEYFYSSGC